MKQEKCSVKTVTVPVVVAAITIMIVPFVNALAQTGETPVSNETNAEQKTGSGKEAVATLAGGCFWCTEAVFERMQGVNDVVSGYIGGHVKNPDLRTGLRQTHGTCRSGRSLLRPDRHQL